MANQENTNKYYRLPILDGLDLLNANFYKKDFPCHTHDTFNISIVLRNIFHTKLSDKSLKAPVGTLSITNPNEVHATPCDHGQGNSFTTYYVSPEVIKQLNKGKDVFFEDKVIYDIDIFNELYSLSYNTCKNKTNFEIRLIAALELLVLKYASVKAVSHSTKKLFQNFINETIFDTFSLSKSASQFGINKYKFLRLFKQETGLTPNHYVLLNKIEKSKNMLKNGKPIFDVAIDSGFYDSSHFYKNFKRFTGVCPLEFQNACFID